MIVVAWSIPALASTVTTIAALQREADPPPLGSAILRSTFIWGVYALLTPPVLWLVWRFPVRAAGRRSRLLLHLAACVVFALISQSIIIAVSQIIDQAPFTFTEWRQRFAQSAPFTLISGVAYWVIFLAGTAVDSARVARIQRDRAAVLERQLAEARLHALQMQIQPHFLFNTLNSIASLVRQGAGERAVDMINRLAALMRQTLRDAGASPAPLHEEIEFIEQYLAIEQTRLGDRLRVRFDLSDDARQASVPPLLVQPLVENAIRHGIAPSTEGGEVAIEARIEGDQLAISVTNDGAPLRDATFRGDPGVGLRNIRERLDAAFGTAATFALLARDGGGAVAELRLPLTPAGGTREATS